MHQSYWKQYMLLILHFLLAIFLQQISSIVEFRFVSFTGDTYCSKAIIVLVTISHLFANAFVYDGKEG